MTALDPLLSNSGVKAFREKLKARAPKKKPVPKAAPAGDKVSMPELLTEMYARVAEIHALLKDHPDHAQPEFIVTERDSDGKIKSFKVES